MLRFLTGATVVCLLLGQAGRVLAEDTAQAIIDKAIKAHGGAEKLAKFKAVQTSGKGTIEVMGMTLSFTAEGAAQMPDKFKSDLVSRMLQARLRTRRIHVAAAVCAVAKVHSRCPSKLGGASVGIR